MLQTLAELGVLWPLPPSWALSSQPAIQVIDSSATSRLIAQVHNYPTLVQIDKADNLVLLSMFRSSSDQNCYDKTLTLWLRSNSTLF